MRTIKTEIVLPRASAKWKLISLSDIHFGSRACDEEQLKADVKRIKADPLAFVILGGDLAESIVFDDFRYEPDLHDVIEPRDFAMKTCKKIIRLLDPIKHKCIAGITGNHEDSFHKRHFFDMANHIYAELGIPYLGYSGMIHLSVMAENQKDDDKAPHFYYNLKILIHHGSGGGGQKGSKVNKIMQQPTAYEADVYIMCHVHDMYATVEPVLTVNNHGHMVSKDRGYIVGGTYYKTNMDGSTTYGEKKMYRPVSIGSPYLTVWREQVATLNERQFGIAKQTYEVRMNAVKYE